MKNIVVYYSETGNTEQLAEMIKNALNCEALNVSLIDENDLLNYDNIILGCPALGAEEISDEIERLTDFLVNNLVNQKIYLFGSYGWGDGEWIRNWSDKFNGACSGILICNEGVENIDNDDFNAFIVSVQYKMG